MVNKGQTDSFIPLTAVRASPRSADVVLDEIRRLYFGASKRTIQRDLSLAVALLTKLNSEGDRERATVYMEGLTEMRKDWAKELAARQARRVKEKPRKPLTS